MMEISNLKNFRSILEQMTINSNVFDITTPTSASGDTELLLRHAALR